MAKLPKDEKEVKQYIELFKNPSTDFNKIHSKFKDVLIFSNKEKIKDMVSEIIDKFKFNNSRQINVNNLLDILSKFTVHLDDMAKYKNKPEDKHTKKILDKLVLDIKKDYECINSSIRRLFDTFETFVNFTLLNLEEFSTFNKCIKVLHDNNFLTHEEYNTLKLFNKIRNIIAHNENLKHAAIVNFYNEISLFRAIIISAHDVFNKLIKILEPRILLNTILYNIRYDAFINVHTYTYIDAFLKNKKLEESYSVTSMKIKDEFSIIDNINHDTIVNELKTYSKFIATYKILIGEEKYDLPEILSEGIKYNQDLDIYEDFDEIYCTLIHVSSFFATDHEVAISDFPLNRELLKIMNNNNNTN